MQLETYTVFGDIFVGSCAGVTLESYSAREVEMQCMRVVFLQSLSPAVVFSGLHYCFCLWSSLLLLFMEDKKAED